MASRGVNKIHVPDNLRSRTCECGDRAVHDEGSCVKCGKRIAVDVLIQEGIASEELLDELAVS